MGCNCCDAPPCPSPIIQCQSISATRSKVIPCGYLNPADGLYYAVKTIAVTISGSFDDPIEPEEIYGRQSGSKSGTISRSYTKVDPLCVEAPAGATGSYFYTVTFSQDGATLTCTVYPDGSSTGTNSAPGRTDTLCDYLGGLPAMTGDVTTTVVSYSSLIETETTEALISRTVEALPEWPEGWVGGCSAFRNLSPDESSYSITRIKWRLTHARTGTCYLKVWLRLRFTPEGGGDPILDDLPPYTWTATGNPCFAVDNEPPDSEANMVTGDEFEEQEPSTDGTTTIEIVKWSCLEGYTPPDDGSANGYPLPE